MDDVSALALIAHEMKINIWDIGAVTGGSQSLSSSILEVEPTYRVILCVHVIRRRIRLVQPLVDTVTQTEFAHPQIGEGGRK